MMDALLSTRNLNVVFNTRDGAVNAVCNVNVNLQKGKVFGLIGETGCGKSVLGHSILRLLPSNARMTGKIIFEGKDILSLPLSDVRRIRGEKIALVPQNPSEALNPLVKNGNQIVETIRLHQKLSGSESRKLAVELLKSLNFRDPKSCMREYPHHLSGGMKQRVLTATGMGGHPDLLIADEPTKGLDALACGQVMETIQKFVESTGSAVLLITHDLKLAARICDQIAVMYAGEIVEEGMTREIFEKPAHPYLKALVSSQPNHGLHVLKGFSPSLIDLPEHCRFYERCPMASAQCKSGPPMIKKINEGHEVRCNSI